MVGGRSNVVPFNNIEINDVMLVAAIYYYYVTTTRAASTTNVREE